MNKKTPNDFPIHPFIEKRWSPRSFESNAVLPEQLRSLFEAARWAPSSYNAQPWRFIVGAQRDQPQVYKKILESLSESNQSWAVNAPALAISFAKTNFESGDPNPHAWHDVGQATAYLTFQASQFGLSIHQMAGIDSEKVFERFDFPAGFEVVAGMAIGFVGNPARLSEPLEKKERAPRSRTPQTEFLFSDGWGVPYRG